MFLKAHYGHKFVEIYRMRLFTGSRINLNIILISSRRRLKINRFAAAERFCSIYLHRGYRR